MIRKTTPFATFCATAVTFYVHVGDETVIFRKTSSFLSEAAERERRQPDVAAGFGA